MYRGWHVNLYDLQRIPFGPIVGVPEILSSPCSAVALTATEARDSGVTGGRRFLYVVPIEGFCSINGHTGHAGWPFFRRAKTDPTVCATAQHGSVIFARPAISKTVISLFIGRLIILRYSARVPRAGSKLIFMYLGADLLLIVLCAHLSNEFELLQVDLGATIKPTKNENEILEDEITAVGREERSIGDFVRRHQKVILLVQLLNISFNKMIFINLLFAAIAIVFFALGGRASRDPTNVANNYMAILVILINMFVLCYSSEMLCTSSSGIAVYAYNNIWYEADMRYRTDIYFIIMRSGFAESIATAAVATVRRQSSTRRRQPSTSAENVVTTAADELSAAVRHEPIEKPSRQSAIGSRQPSDDSR
ncbi:hypothetical protein evm_008487 [Chilo suppressalis]|nr:hypothetical protein evm_008487 [Chilo suppressalis]